jgi:hypothetical protein
MLSIFDHFINQFEVDNLGFRDRIESYWINSSIRGFKEKRKPRNQLNSG